MVQRYASLIAALSFGTLGALTGLALTGCGDDATTVAEPSGGGTTGGQADTASTGGSTDGGTTTGEDLPSCDLIHGIGCGQTVQGDSSGGPKAVSSYACSSGVSYTGAEASYAITADSNTTVTFRVTPAGPHDVLVMESENSTGKDCNPAKCVSGQSGEDAGVAVKLNKGEKRWVSVERRDGGEGPFTLQVECCDPQCGSKKCGDDGCGGTCGTCPGGNVCNATGACVKEACEPTSALLCGDELGLTAMTDPGSSDLLTAYACNEEDYSGQEVTYSFFSGFDQTVTLDFGKSDATKSVDLLLMKDSGDGTCSPSECVQVVDDKLTFEAKSGDQYYMTIDGRAGDLSLFTLKLDCCKPTCSGKVCGDNGCGGICGECAGTCSDDGGTCTVTIDNTNQTCGTAAKIPSLPYSVMGDNTGFSENYTTAGCADASYPAVGADAVFSYTATVTGLVGVKLTSGTSEYLYVTAGCPGDDLTACIGVVDYDETPNGVVQWAAQAGTEYFIVVDGFSSSEFFAGPYTLDAFAL
ncbi:MAG: hypothetical protein ACI9WU_004625 [Myxococcota bacterium]|jgi:hypothetical protein